MSDRAKKLACVGQRRPRRTSRRPCNRHVPVVVSYQWLPLVQCLEPLLRVGDEQFPDPGLEKDESYAIMSAMKSRRGFASKALLILAFVCAIFSISTVAQASSPPGRLIVNRVPNFGWNLGFHLQIDGRSVASIAQGHQYEGWLPAGRHVLTVHKVRYVGYSEPTSTTVNIQPGWTYVFTAMWDSNLVYLRRLEVLTPGELWQLRP